MPFTVLVTAPKLAAAGLALLNEAGCRVIFMPTSQTPDDLSRILATEPVDAIISRTRALTAEMIANCPTLKVISRHGIGYDNVDLPAATELGIPVLVTPATNGVSVAELAIGLMFAAARRISHHDLLIREGKWDRTGQGLQLSGRRLGLIGLGGIGRHVAHIAMACGMKVSAHDTMSSVAVDGVTMVDQLATLVRNSDVISLHCPLTPETRHLINAAMIAMLPKGAIVINTARGGLIDEAALAEALKSGHLAGAGLDTLEQEPPGSDNPLLKLSSVVLTPHMGGSTDAALAATAAAAARNALQVLRGEGVPRTVCVNQAIFEKENS